MTTNTTERVRQYVVGDERPRRAIVGTVLVLLGLASVAFVLGFDVGLSAFGGGWVVVALGIAVGAGLLGAGLGPTVGSMWLIAFWWFVFPPLVGYLTGVWEGAARYAHPRMLGFAYTTARAEVLGGLEYALRLGSFFALVPGAMVHPRLVDDDTRGGDGLFLVVLDDGEGPLDDVEDVRRARVGVWAEFGTRPEGEHLEEDVIAVREFLVDDLLGRGVEVWESVECHTRGLVGS